MAKKKPAQYVITADAVVFQTRRASYTVRKDHPFFAEIKEALKRNDTLGAYRLQIKRNRSDSKLAVRGDDLWFDGKRFHTAFAEAYAVAKDHGAGYAALEAFFTNLAANPNPISVEAFTAFMANTRMPITDRGTFLAYRRCNADYTDHHTRSFDNAPTAVCAMPRSACDARQDNTCSTGFHVCAHTYLENFNAGPDLVVEVNPRHVVAVPPDYNLSKMRLSSFRVLSRLDYFKSQMLNHYQDALATIPFFVTEQVRGWDVMTGVPDHVVRRASPARMSFDQWAAMPDT